MTNNRMRPCCFCGKPIRLVPQGYTVVWNEGKYFFAHDECVEKSGQCSSALTPEEICKEMRPLMEGAFNELKEAIEKMEKKDDEG